tara:strand:+ start:1057 stop:1362 length:306 start_codon:yes stop_codon:yes gene_type:complete
MRNRTQNITKNRTNQGKRYYQPLRYPDIPLSSNDIYIRTIIGDRLDSLADQFYNDVRLWWIIATANPQIVRRDGYALKPNLEIRIPSNTTQILKSFEQINK